VRIHIDEVPDGVRLVAGITATVQITRLRGSAVPGKSATSQMPPDHVRDAHLRDANLK
jgi:hypothetical protein